MSGLQDVATPFPVITEPTSPSLFLMLSSPPPSLAEDDTALGVEPGAVLSLGASAVADELMLLALLAEDASEGLDEPRWSHFTRSLLRDLADPTDGSIQNELLKNSFFFPRERR